MDSLALILIVCVAVFLLSFCLLYRQKVAQFFKIIGGGIKKFFGLFKKGNGKVAKQKSKDRLEKSELQSRPVLLLPNANTKSGENKEQSNDDKKQNAQEAIKTGGKFVSSNEKIVAQQNFESKKKSMQDDFDKFLDELEEETNDKNTSHDLDNFFAEDEGDSEEEKFDDKIKENNSIKVDGEDVDLSKLPPKIRRLLLSGMLDRKDD